MFRRRFLAELDCADALCWSGGSERFWRPSDGISVLLCVVLEIRETKPLFMCVVPGQKASLARSGSPDSHPGGLLGLFISFKWGLMKLVSSDCEAKWRNGFSHRFVSGSRPKRPGWRPTEPHHRTYCTNSSPFLPWSALSLVNATTQYSKSTVL